MSVSVSPPTPELLTQATEAARAAIAAYWADPSFVHVPGEDDIATAVKAVLSLPQVLQALTTQAALDGTETIDDGYAVEVTVPVSGFGDGRPVKLRHATVFLSYLRAAGRVVGGVGEP